MDGGSFAVMEHKERPILFSGAMVRAILDGRKTQTRRVVKAEIPEQLTHVRRLTNANGDEGAVITEHPDMRAGQLAASVWCPYGKVGSRLWVREAHYVERAPSEGETGFILYKATDHEAPVSKWRPSIHMPRWASRILLEVVGVRVERLNDISEDDAKAEGVDPNGPVGYIPAVMEMGMCRYQYANLWVSINGPGSWEKNPWVWVVEFRVVKP